MKTSRATNSEEWDWPPPPRRLLHASITIEHEPAPATMPRADFGKRAFSVYAKILTGLFKYGLVSVVGFVIFWVVWAVVVAALNSSVPVQ